MSKWPQQVAKTLFTVGFAISSESLRELRLLSGIYKIMEVEQQPGFIQTAANLLNARTDGQKVYVNVLAALTEEEYKTPILEILAQNPERLAEVMNLSTMKESLGECALLKMTDEQKSIYRSHFMKIFSKPDLKVRLTEELKDLLANPSKIPQSYALAYFIHHPEEFKGLVLKQEILGDEKSRGQLALNLLEHMGISAETVIETMDSLTKGYPYYNYLINLLVREAAGMNINSISNSRAILMARFDLAKDGGKTIKKITLGKAVLSWDSDWKRIADGPIWDNFDTAAASKYPQVYVNKQ